MQLENGEIILYQAEDGKTAVDVHFKDETVWLTQAQMVELFEKTKQNISLHIRNIFAEGELQEEAVVKDSLTTALDGKRYKTKYYNLDVIISVGYRVKPQRGTQFRIWATSVLKDHLVNGYSLNRKRLAEKGAHELRQVLTLLSNTLEGHDLVNEEGRAVLDIVNRYSKTWKILLQYDEDAFPVPRSDQDEKAVLELSETRAAIASLKNDLMEKGEATELFGQERGHGLEGILSAVRQTFGGQDLYPGIAQKAAHLLYFVIKDHPFSDGNKRAGAFLFLLFLKMNNRLDEQNFSNNALVALTLLTAASDPNQKEILVRLIMNLIE